MKCVTYRFPSYRLRLLFWTIIFIPLPILGALAVYYWQSQTFFIIALQYGSVLLLLIYYLSELELYLSPKVVIIVNLRERKAIVYARNSSRKEITIIGLTRDDGHMHVLIWYFNMPVKAGGSNIAIIDLSSNSIIEALEELTVRGRLNRLRVRVQHGENIFHVKPLMVKVCLGS